MELLLTIFIIAYHNFVFVIATVSHNGNLTHNWTLYLTVQLYFISQLPVALFYTEAKTDFHTLMASVIYSVMFAMPKNSNVAQFKALDSTLTDKLACWVFFSTIKMHHISPSLYQGYIQHFIATFYPTKIIQPLFIQGQNYCT